MKKENQLPCVSPWQLGATMYTPALHPALNEIMSGTKYPNLKSLVICLEDSIAHRDREASLLKLTLALNLHQDKPTTTPPLLFLRPFDLNMAEYFVDSLDLSCVTGFVIPKFSLSSLKQWEAVVRDTHLLVMPTLETREVLDVTSMSALALVLDQSELRERILALRIGGNDLLSTLSLRRARDLTIYDSPLGYTISMLTSIFGARGYALTSPVFEHIDQPHVLAQELMRDRAHGLVGKTAIHPSQLDTINSAFSVTIAEHNEAVKILESERGVFQSNGSMCEPATHKNWANQTLERSRLLGIAAP